MRAREFVSEQKSILSRALPTTFQYPGMLSSNPYDIYRFGIANGYAREYYGEAKTSWCQ